MAGLGRTDNLSAVLHGPLDIRMVTIASTFQLLWK